MDEKDKTIDHNMAGNKIIRFDVGIKRIHSRHEAVSYTHLTLPTKA